MERRSFLTATIAGAAGVSCSGPAADTKSASAAAGSLPLSEFEPKSMLVVAETDITKAAFPVIDVHTHVAGIFRRQPAPDSPLNGTPTERFAKVVQWMDEMNIKTLVNYSSPADRLDTILREMVEPHPGRYITCIQPSYKDMGDADYPARQAEEIRNGHAQGARGLKISKALGLGVRENGDSGPLIKVDDPRLDPMWEEAGKLGMPVFIHVSDPDAFFIPVDRFNERWDELGNHPNWSFYGDDYPPKAEILAARNRVIERHPNTQFVGLHVANHAENLDEVSAWLDKYPNMHCELGARIGELGRQPRRSRKFFEEYQDRIMFGTDASPNSPSVPQQILIPEMYHCYFRFLETLDEYFDYSPSPVGPQGRWKIYGVGLPEQILKKVYHNNAARILGLETI
jgi:predicted TIM-barrel fold metal-dependent hydrolase